MTDDHPQGSEAGKAPYTKPDPVQRRKELVDRIVTSTDWDLVEAAHWESQVRDDPRELGYEGVMEPIRLTAGQVCLKLSTHGSPPTRWVTVDRGDQINMAQTGSPVRLGVSPGTVKEKIHLSNWAVTPVLRDDTPFAEVDDE